jgi:DNA-binding response OmpR family regulator
LSRVLVVDDEPLIAALLCDWLVELGHEPVGPASNEDAARRLIDSTPFDAAVLDVSLAGGDSFGLAAACRERSVPFAFATGHGRSKLPPDLADATILPKPFTFDDVRQLLADLLG